jgi:hypothetical protein
LFSTIYISRQLPNGTVQDSFKVPLSYEARDKMLARLEDDAKLDRADSMHLPRLAYVLKNYQPDPARRISPINRRVAKDPTNPKAYNQTIQPVPYTFDFEVSIYSKTLEDGHRILETILCNFNPDWTVTGYLLDDMPDYKHDIPINFLGIVQDDKDDGSFTDRRILTWTLSFRLSGYMFGPVKKAKVIRVVQVDFIEPHDTGNVLLEQDLFRPGRDGKQRAHQ